MKEEEEEGSLGDMELGYPPDGNVEKVHPTRRLMEINRGDGGDEEEVDELAEDDDEGKFYIVLSTFPYT